MTEVPTAAAPLDLTDYGEAILIAAEAQAAGFQRVAVAPEHFLALVAEIKRLTVCHDALAICLDAVAEALDLPEPGAPYAELGGHVAELRKKFEACDTERECLIHGTP